MTSEQIKLVEDNMRLVTHTIAKYYPYAKGDEDMFQIGCLGLIKAAKRFKEDKGMAFSSFAIINIQGEICREYRARKTQKRKANFESVSLDNVSNADNEKGDKETSYYDLLKDYIDVEEKAIENIMFNEVLRIINNLKENQMEAIILYHLYGIPQSEIAEILNKTQASVSRYIIKGCESIRKEICVC